MFDMVKIIVKQDCIVHIEKKMGTNLRNYKKYHKGRAFSDGDPVGGRGRVTYDVIGRFQN